MVHKIKEFLKGLGKSQPSEVEEDLMVEDEEEQSVLQKSVFSKRDVQKGIGVIFQTKNDMSKSDKGEFNKRLFSLETAEGISYLFRGRSKLKYPRETAIAILDGIENGFRNIILVLKKDVVLITKGEREGVFYVELMPRNKYDKINANGFFGEGYFEGEPYRVVEDIEETAQLYIKDNSTKTKLLLLLFLMIAGAAGYVKYQEDQGNKTHVKPPMPILDQPSEQEHNYYKHMLSIDLFKSIVDKAKKVAKESNNGLDTVHTTRLASVSFSQYTNIEQQQPYYDEEENEWLYEDELKKRGGLNAVYTMTIEKNYPDIGYAFKEKVGSKKIYRKDETKELQKIFNPDGAFFEKIPLTKECVVKALKLGKIKERNNGSIHFVISGKSNTGNYPYVVKIVDILKECPAYIENSTMSEMGFIDGNLIMYYDFKSSKKDTNSSDGE